MRDSDDDAPLIRTQFAEVARCPPNTVGGRFAAFVGSGDCEEFDLAIADGPEEPDPVVFTAQDTVTDVASTLWIDTILRPQFVGCLDRDLAREDAEFEVGVVVADTTVESDSDAVSTFGDGDMPADPGPRDVVDFHVTPAIREGLLSLDEIDLVPIFKRRACIMKAPPTFLKGACGSAMRLALSEAESGHRAGDEARISRVWKLFLLLPRILLHRPPIGGKQGKLLERFTEFSRGQWIQLLTISFDCADRAMVSQSRRRRTQQDSVERRADRAEALVCTGELSAGRQALEGAPVAPDDKMLRELRNPVRRPPQLRAPLSEDLQTAQPEIPIQLGQGLLVKNLKSAQLGAEHLRPLLDSEADCEVLVSLPGFCASTHPRGSPHCCEDGTHHCVAETFWRH